MGRPPLAHGPLGRRLLAADRRGHAPRLRLPDLAQRRPRNLPRAHRPLALRLLGVRRPRRRLGRPLLALLPRQPRRQEDRQRRRAGPDQPRPPPPPPPHPRRPTRPRGAPPPSRRPLP